MAFYPIEDHECRYRETGGSFTAWTPCTVKPIAVGNINIAIGDFQVRVMAKNGNPAGDILSNDSAFTYTPAATLPPLNLVVDDNADTLDWEDQPGYAALTNKEYTLNGGTTYNPVTSKPLVIGNVKKLAGQVGIRYKANGSIPASATVYAGSFTEVLDQLLYLSDLKARFNGLSVTVDENDNVESVISNFNGNSFELLSPATTSRKPKLIRNGIGGNKNLLRFTAANQQFLSGGDILDIGTESRTIFVMTKVSASGRSGVHSILSKSTGATTSGDFQIATNGANYSIGAERWHETGGAVASDYITPAISTIGNDLIAMVFDRSPQSLRVYLNGSVLYDGYMTSSATALNNAWRYLVGAASNSTDTGETDFFDGDIIDILDFNRAFSSGEVATQSNKIRTFWETFESDGNIGKAKISTIGDSLTYGLGSGYPSQLSYLLDASKFTLPVINNGNPGWTTAQTLTAYRTYLSTGYDAASSRNIMFVMLGTNDLMQNVPLSTIQSNMTEICTTADREGWKVVVIVPPQLQGKPDYFTYRTWLLANWDTTLKAKAVFDIYTDPLIGSYTTSADTATYWNSDQIHLTAAGYQRLGDLLQPIAEDLEAQLSIIPLAPNDLVVDDNNNTFAFSSPEALSNLEYTLDEGQTTATVLGNPIPIGNLPKAVGTVGVRVKARGNNPCSAWAYNATPFTSTASGDEYVPYSSIRWEYVKVNETTGVATPFPWDIGAGFAYTGNRTFNGDRYTARIEFTKGIRIIVEGGAAYLPWGVCCYIDGVQVNPDGTPGTGVTTVNAAGDVMFEYHPDTTTPKLLEIGRPPSGGGNYIILSGAQLYF